MGQNLTRKILHAHLVEGRLIPGEEIGLRVDQVLTQDFTATQVFLEFEAMGLSRVRCRVAACYADHNVLQVRPEHMEDHLYLQSASRKYGIWFGKPACGIGHQVHLERFAVPGETVLGADSHTPHCGGVGMFAIGAGGMDVAAAMAGGPYYFDMPHVVGVRLTGALPPWSSAKDVILELLRRLTTRGGAGKVFEFTGPGVRTLNGQQRATITNMSYELGATTSIFPSDELTKDYFRRLGRAEDWRELLPDAGAEYDDTLHLDLSSVEPLVALPSAPDNVVPVREAAGTTVQQVMVGSCTNGAYADIKAVAAIVKGRRVHPEVYFFIHPSSRADLEALAQEGSVAALLAAGVNVAEATCGACIGVGHVPAPGTRSLRAINRNFKGRSGLADDAVYLASPETAAATALTGVITDPRDLARALGIAAPSDDLPDGIEPSTPDLVPPATSTEAADAAVHHGSNMMPVPLRAPLEETLTGTVLLKIGDNITTDHIVPAGSESMAFQANIPRLAEYVFHRLAPGFARRAIERGGGFIVAGENYGQGSSREQAAMAPMFLGVKGVLAKSFARIHHANLINWGLIPMVFADPADYASVDADDELTITGVRDYIDSGGTESIPVRNATKDRTFLVTVDLNARERRYLRAGGRLAHVKAQSPR